MKSIGKQIKAVVGLTLAARAAGTVVGPAIDRTGFDELALLLQSGAATGSPTSFTADAKITHCDTSGGTYTDYTPPTPTPSPSGAVATVTAIDSVKKRSVDLRAAKQFIKVSQTNAFVGGTTPTLLTGSTVLLGAADTLPIADD